MTHDDDDGLYNEIFDLPLRDITAAALQEALTEFPLPLQDGKDWAWLAMAVRRALGIAAPNEGKVSAVEVRAELAARAAAAEKLWKELFEMKGPPENYLFGFTWMKGNEQDWDGNFEVEPYTPPLWLEYQAALSQLNWLGSFLREAEKRVQSQPMKWRTAADRKARISRGQYLAPIFENAFGEAPTANNQGNGIYDGEQTPFMQFYKAVEMLAYGESNTPDIVGVTKEASRLHKVQPIVFSDSVIPGLTYRLVIKTPEPE
jgi:hypothetical protein